MSTTSPIFLLPAPQGSDAANIEQAVPPLRDRLETVLGLVLSAGILDSSVDAGDLVRRNSMHQGVAYNAANNWTAAYFASNIRYDKSSGNWINDPIGGNNGWAVIASTGTAGGLQIYTDAATGNVQRIYTPAQFLAKLVASLNPSGALTLTSVNAGGVILPPPAVTSLSPGVGPIPSSIPDGFEVYYVADLAAGIRWHLRYRLATTEWLCVGGRPLVSVVDGLEGPTVGTGYGGLATPGPAITPPLTGDYDIEIEATAYNNGSGTMQAFLSYQIGATAAIDFDAAVSVMPTPESQVPTSRRKRKTLTAGDALSMRYKAPVGSGMFARRYMSLTPVRIPA